jgi:outer membrane protein assembly factor BamB
MGDTAMAGGIGKPESGSALSPGRRSRVCAVAAAVAVALALGLSAVPAAAVGATITLTRSVGPPTSKVTVTGTGFNADEVILVDFDTSPVATVPPTITTTSSGSFAATFNVPTSALPKRYVVTATGQTSHLSATHNFLVRTDWAKFHFDPSNSGSNPYENAIGTSTVSGLNPAWTAATSTPLGSVGSSPAVAGEVVYILSTNGNLYAYSADGTNGCSGTPPTKTCPPLWIGTAGTGSSADTSSPTVAGGVVYVGAGHNLYAFTAGSKPSSTCHLMGTPAIPTCPPLWTAVTGWYITASPVVVGGALYVSSEDGYVYAFTAGRNPSTNTCPPIGTPAIKTCPPLWKGAAPGGYTTPAVAGRPAVVYVGSTDHYVYAFDGTGSATNCSPTTDSDSGSAVTYTANTLTDTSKSWAQNRWAGATVSVNGGAQTAIAASNSATTIYLTANWSGGTPPAAGSLYNVTVKTCTPLWRGTAGASTSSSPAVVGGVLYIGAAFNLYAFNAGTSPPNCPLKPPSPIPTCSPLWISANGSTAGGVEASPAVAGGVVYVGSSDGKLYAFNAGNSPRNCFMTGAPLTNTCPPLWTAVGGGPPTGSSPAVAHGVVFSGDGGPNLSAFSASGSPTNCSTTTASGSGSTVTYAPNGLTDTSKSWVAGQWAYATLSVNGGGEKAIAPSNSATTITLTANWTVTPAAGSPYNVTVTTCPPLRTVTTGSNSTPSSPAVANGMVYIGEWDGAGLYVFSLGP